MLFGVLFVVLAPLDVLVVILVGGVEPSRYRD